MRHRAPVYPEPVGGGRGAPRPEQLGGVALPGRPAPVERRVVAREGGQDRVRRAESREREHQAAALGSVHGGAGRVEAWAIDFGRGNAAWQRRGDRPLSAGDHPVDVGELRAHRVDDLPDGGRGREQALELVAEGEGEARGEHLAPAAVERGERGAQRVLEAGATRGGELPGGDGVADERNIVNCHITSCWSNMTVFVNFN